MCISKNFSILSFLIAILSSILLIKLVKTNSSKVIGYFFIFVAFMQIIDYLIWIDLDCSKGFNLFASKLAHFIHNLQPVVLIILIKHFMNPRNAIFNNLYYPIIVIYTLYVLYTYCNYIKENSLCTNTNIYGHLKWKWMDSFNYIPYHLIFLFVFFLLYDNITIRYSFIYSYLLFFFSLYRFKENVGEIWCFIISSVPLSTLLLIKLKRIRE